MFFYVARQPIFSKNKEIYAYELLFRDGVNNAFPDISPETATANLVENGQFLSNFSEITENHLAFINFTEQALLSDLPSLLSTKNVVIEVLETVQPSQKVFKALIQLKNKGYLIALDDFDYSELWYPILGIIDFIKIDLRASSVEQIQTVIQLSKQYKFKLLAEKVESYEEFQQCLNMGFKLFQGYFFAKPELIQKRTIPGNQLIYTQLLTACTKKNIDFDEVAHILQLDVSLSYKVLRFVNAPIYGVSSKIDSIHQAVVFLGEIELKRFAAITTTAQLATNKPTELIKLSIIRARYCQLLAEYSKITINHEQAFLVGLFSMLDAILDKPMPEIITELELSEVYEQALVLKKGALTYCLAIAFYYEQANWKRSQMLCDRLGINFKKLPTLYLEALNWTKHLLEQ